MSKRNQHRVGYKQTKAGWIPVDWSVCSFNDILARTMQPVNVDSENSYEEIGIKSHGKGIFHKAPVLGVELGNKAVFWVQVPSLMFNIVFAWEQAVAVSSERERGKIASHRFPMYRPRSEGIDLHYVCYYFLTKKGKHLLGLASPGGAGRNKTLGQGDLALLPVPLPRLPEQVRIAAIISTWNNAIELTRRLHESKIQRKKALMQQLLTGKKRLRGSTEEWKEYRLGDLFVERTETNKAHLPLLAITGGRGVILANEIDRKDASAEDKSSYKRIAPGDIGYNTMRMWQGVSAVSGLEGIVSPAYTVCVPNATVDVRFMGYLFKFPPVVNSFHRHSQGLVSDTLNLKFPHFARIKVKIPHVDEQQRIAEVLSTVDHEIDGLEKNLTALERQKRGLMQKLLTGEVRVRV
ncbi:MAG: restriction endonuclease subunit S [Thermodesulfobacteriota bacterium]